MKNIVFHFSKTAKQMKILLNSGIGEHANTEKRTGIKNGDIVTIYYHTDKQYLLMAVGRPSLAPTLNCTALRFEGSGNDDKNIIMGYPINKNGARAFILLVCQITGLQAKQVNEFDNCVMFKMGKGKRIFAKNKPS